MHEMKNFSGSIVLLLFLLYSGTQPGKVLRLRGKGLPNVNGYGTGDLLVNVSVYVPETLSKDEKRALEEMEESDNFKPNTSIKEKIFKKFKSLFD